MKEDHINLSFRALKEEREHLEKVIAELDTQILEILDKQQQINQRIGAVNSILDTYKKIFDTGNQDSSFQIELAQKFTARGRISVSKAVMDYLEKKSPEWLTPAEIRDYLFQNYFPEKDLEKLGRAVHSALLYNKKKNRIELRISYVSQGKTQNEYRFPENSTQQKVQLKSKELNNNSREE